MCGCDYMDCVGGAAFIAAVECVCACVCVCVGVHVWVCGCDCVRKEGSVCMHCRKEMVISVAAECHHVTPTLSYPILLRLNA